ncbi:MAG: CotH kinase family protein, partial [Thermodesulfobacteriota bacterium]|nr:CotH kinase family protein [Thermodesulfobacteriota bacterium]
MFRHMILLPLPAFCFSVLISMALYNNTATAEPLVSNGSNTTQRPHGWTEETHGDNATPNYDIVFARDVVKRIDLTIGPADWKAMLEDMTENYGDYGKSGCGGQIPLNACRLCEGLQDGDPCTILLLFGLVKIHGTCMTMPGQRVCTPDFLTDMGPPAGVPPDSFFGSSPKPIYRPCTFTFEGRTWWHVGVRFKGQSSLVYPWEIGGTKKFPFRFDFDEFEDVFPEIDNQRFFGFKELSMCSNFNDNSLLREKVVGDIFREAGVPAPQNAFYRLFIEYGVGPVYFGLYTMVEVPRKPMLETQFGDPDGNLYKPEGQGARWATFDEESFVKKTNTSEHDWSDVEAAFTALHAPRDDPAEWRAGLEAVFDVDGFLRWLAVNTVIQNWDTYGNMPQNYYIYSDPQDGQLHWIPWDNNEALKSTGVLVDPLPLSLDSNVVDESWPLIRYIMDDPVYHATYLSFVHDTIEGAFFVTRSQTRLINAHDLISPFVVGHDGEQNGHTLLAGPEDFGIELDNLLDHVAQRRNEALQFLSHESFDSANIIINEIHYNPPVYQGEDKDYEFIELYN